MGNNVIELLKNKGVSACEEEGHIHLNVVMEDQSAWNKVRVNLLDSKIPNIAGGHESIMKGTSKQAPLSKASLPKELFIDYDDLDKQGKLAEIKQRDYTLYAVIYLNRFGLYPKGALGNDKFDISLKIIYEDAVKQYVIDELSKMDWDQLVKADKTTDMKRLSPYLYTTKFFNKFKRWPAEGADFINATPSDLADTIVRKFVNKKASK